MRLALVGLEGVGGGGYGEEIAFLAFPFGSNVPWLLASSPVYLRGTGGKGESWVGDGPGKLFAYRICAARWLQGTSGHVGCIT